jgi:hypothetical protein
MNIPQKFVLIALACSPMAANAVVVGVTGQDGSALVYDSLNNATWPADANLFASQYSTSTIDTIIQDAAGLPSLDGYTLSSADFNSNGLMSWYGAEAWVHYLNVISYGGSTHWSLPKSVTGEDIAGYPDGIGQDPSPYTSQLATLFYLELGQVADVAITTTNNGAAGYDLFSNVQVDAYSFYWGLTRDTYAPPDYVWSFDTSSGNQFGVAKSGFFWFTLPVSPKQVHSAPAMRATMTGTPGTNGWYISDPTKLSWTVVGYPAPTKSGCGTVTVPQTSGRTYTCSATNEFGTASSPEIIKVDHTAPTVSISRPASGAVYRLNQKVPATYACHDSLSGVASCAGSVADGADILTSTAGPQTFTVTATDNAGNTFTKAVPYNVGSAASARRNRFFG